jgi:hypothetical protein
MISLLQRVLSLVTAATLSALSGEANAGQVGTEPINTPSLTFPGDTVLSPKRGPGCQGIVPLLTTPPVFVAEAQPPEADQTPINPPQPTRTIIDVINEQGQIIKKGLKDSLEKFRNRPPIPGS